MSSQAAASGKLVYVGTYTRSGASKGIYAYRFAPDTGELTFTGQTFQLDNPSFLVVHPSGKFLYSVCETARSDKKPGGMVAALAIDRVTGALTLLNRQSSHGAGPCHVDIDPTGKLLLVANYGSGTVAALPVDQDGRLAEASAVIQHEGSSVNPKRQKGPHAHSITVAPDGRYAFAADLGVDKMLAYRLDPDAQTMAAHADGSAAVTPGAGPRHFAFHPSGKYAYAINELDSTVTAFRYDPTDGRLTVLQSESTLPADFAESSYCADIHVSANGTFLYGSNRGHDSIVVFRIDSATGQLTLVGHQSTLGNWPRNFALSPSGAFLLAANRKSDNVVVFRIGPDSGMLTPTGHTASIPQPVCVVFAEY